MKNFKASWAAILGIAIGVTLVSCHNEKQTKEYERQQYLNSSDFYDTTQAYYLELIKHYIKDFYQIELKVEDDPNIMFLGIAGYLPDLDVLKVSSMAFALGGRNKTSSMQSVFHETRHKMQHDGYRAKDVEEAFQHPENMILLAKEDAYIDSQDEEFYKTNYPLLYTETDADEFGFMAVRILLENLIRRYKHQGKQLSMEDEILLRKLQKMMIEDSVKDEERFYETNRFATKIRREAMGMDPPTGEFKIGDEQQDRLIAVDQYMKTHPELVMEYPILNLVMGKDYDEIIRDRAEYMEKEPEKASRLYQCIIASDPMLYIEDCIREVKEYQLQKFLEKHPKLVESYPEELKALANKTDHPMIKQLLASVNQL